MSTDLDTTRIVRSWLHTDEHESADRVLDDVLARLDTTPQRPSWWPARRSPTMNALTKFSIAAAAVVAIAIVGINLLPRVGGDVGVAPTATPSPTPSASQAPSASIAFPPPGALAPGRHTLLEDGIVFSLEVPSGWSSSGLNCGGCAPGAGWLQRGADASTDPGSVWMPIWSVDGVASDPCTRQGGPAATSVAELADAVAALPGTNLVTAPKDVTVNGRPAKYVAITVPDDIACSPDKFFMWYDGSPAGGFRWANALGQTNRVWIMDVDGTRIWIEAETYRGANPEIATEIQGMIDSIRFE